MASHPNPGSSPLDTNDAFQLHLEFRRCIPNVDRIEFFPRIRGFEDQGPRECGVVIFRQRSLGSVVRLHYN